MGSESKWYQTGNKTCYIPKICKFFTEKGYILTGLKVLSLVCKCAFYITEHNARGLTHGTEF